jgi:hypothetical protein
MNLKTDEKPRQNLNESPMT